MGKRIGIAAFILAPSIIGGAIWLLFGMVDSPHLTDGEQAHIEWALPVIGAILSFTFLQIVIVMWLWDRFEGWLERRRNRKLLEE